MLERSFVREKAYSLLRDWIIQGTLKPAQKLRDKELAEQLGVSRTPIREALLRLEEEGLVQTKPNSSTIVSPLEFENAPNLYSIVWTLEGLALKQAFNSITEKHLENMREANEKMFEALEANKPVLAIEADQVFHSTYIDLSNNKDLCQMLFLAKQKINRLKIFYFQEIKDTRVSYREHQLIIDALKQKDLTKALEAVECNWQASCTRIQAQGNYFIKGIKQ